MKILSISNYQFFIISFLVTKKLHDLASLQKDYTPQIGGHLVTNFYSSLYHKLTTHKNWNVI